MFFHYYLCGMSYSKYRFGLLCVLLGLAFSQEETLILRRTAKSPKKASELTPQEAASRFYLKGRVVDQATKEPLAGAYVRVPGSVLGAVTDAEGSFIIATTLTEPVQVEVSYIGYQTMQMLVQPSTAEEQGLLIALKAEDIVGEEVVISASRVEEAFMRSPVQIAQLPARLIQQSPTPFLAQTLSFLPGVQVFHTSFTFPVINTRGFSNTQNVRFINRVQGVEMQSTALNIPVVTFTSPSEIDVAQVEVVSGPSSALYGPNAFNGAMLTTLKDPFQYRGLSVWLQGGVNHLASPNRSPAAFYNLQLRYAHVWRERLAIKFTLQRLEGADWFASSTQDVGLYGGATPPYDLPGPQNPGYKPENGYGYDARVFIPTGSLPMVNSQPFPGMYVARTGYLEPDLVSPQAQIFKGSLSAIYRLSDQLALELFSHAATGNTFYQANTRYALYGFVYHAHKLELKHSRGFFRVYGIKEDGGRAAPLAVLGANLLNVVKPHADWFKQFILTYSGYLEASMTPAEKAAFEAHYGFPVPALGDATGARRLIDSDTRFVMTLPNAAIVAPALGTSWAIGEARPLPGSPRFYQLRDSLLQIPVTQGGGRLVDLCGIYHAEGQYELPAWLGIQTLIGGNFRLFEINSRGTIFIDTLGKPFWNYEFGGFVQLRRFFLSDRLQLTGALRYDQRQYVLQGRLTPRFSATFGLDKKGNHVLRVGYQTGFRNPISEALFIRLQTEALLIGTLPQTDRALGIAGQNNYTLASVQAYRAARAQGLSPQDAAQLLRSLPIDGLRPEKVYTWEVGLRHRLLAQRLLIDLSYAYNRYRDMHGNVRVYGPKDPEAILTPNDVEINNLSPLYGRYYNIPGEPKAQFLTCGLQYRLSRHLIAMANYVYSQAWGLEEGKTLDEGLVVGFNTPPHQTNLGLIGENIRDRWGFFIQHQWVHAYLFETTSIQRVVPTYNVFHAQVSYRLPKWHTQIRLGAQNLLNFYHIEARGGPSVGGLYYLQLSYDALSF